MATNRIVTKALAGVEDLLLGDGVVSQDRNGSPTNITKINASNLSYNATSSIRDKLAEKPEVLNTVAEMQALATSIEAEIYVYLLGYYEAGDGGGGLFWLDTSDTTSVEDNSLIFNPDILANGRWKRIDTQNQVSPDSGDADKTLLAYDEGIQIFETALTADRTVTLPAANNFNGQTFTILRRDSAAFNLVIDSIHVLTSPGYVIVSYADSAWTVIQTKLDELELALPVTGTDTYTASLTYVTDKTYSLSFANTNTVAAPTVDGKTIKNSDGSALAIGAIPNESLVRYDGVAMILLNPQILFASVAEVEAGTNGEKIVSPLTQGDHATASKAWVKFNGQGTITILKQHNVSGLVDDGVGNYTIVIGSDMADDDYVCLVTMRQDDAAGGNYSAGTIDEASTLAISVQLLCQFSTGANADSDVIGVALFGDLA